ncbi:MAG: DUF87 domain-containing protein [Planctomycetota bacterium]
MRQSFEAPTLSQALARAQRALGPQATLRHVERLGPRGVRVEVEGPGLDLGARLAARGIHPARRASLLQDLSPDAEGAQRLRWRVERALPVDPRAGKHVARHVALVGPTGVGKTTTVAKLAARAMLDQGLRVGLVTLDLYRVAAVDHLRTYADLLGVPLAVAQDRRELAGALAQFADRDLVLVDTAGRSPRDPARLAELAGLLQGVDLHVNLVLAANASYHALRDARERFAALRPRGLVLTKLDEVSHPGDAFEALATDELPLRWTTDGQEVPDDLDPACAHALASWVLGAEEQCA